MSDPAATSQDGDAVASAATLEKQPAVSSDTQQNSSPPAEVDSIELPAPVGWRKKFVPKKGGTPSRNEIVFIAPTGEEIKNKRQLELYLKSHPGGPPTSDFVWGTGDTPRRSARISERARATVNPEGKPSKKRGRGSGGKNGEEEKLDDAEERTPVKQDAKGAEDEGDDGDMKELEDEAERGEEDVSVEEKEDGGGDVAMEEAKGGEESGKEDVAAGEEKEDAGSAAIKEAEFGTEKAKEELKNGARMNEPLTGHHENNQKEEDAGSAAIKEAELGTEKAKEELKNGARMNEPLTGHHENNQKEEEAGLEEHHPEEDADSRMDGKEQSQAVKVVEDVEANKCQTDTMEDGMTQAKNEEGKPEEEHTDSTLESESRARTTAINSIS